MSEGRVSDVFSHPSHRKIKYNLSIYKIICTLFKGRRHFLVSPPNHHEKNLLLCVLRMLLIIISSQNYIEFNIYPKS